MANETNKISGALIQLNPPNCVTDLYMTGNPQISFFTTGMTKKLLHPELYNENILKPFNPRTDDMKKFPKEKYSGEIIYKEDEPILKKYGHSLFSNEENHLIPYHSYLKYVYCSIYNEGDIINKVVPYEY